MEKWFRISLFGLLWCATVVGFTSARGPEVLSLIVFESEFLLNYVHFLSMLLLSVAASWLRVPPKIATRYVFLACYAIAIEATHLVSPARSFELVDLAQNLLGVLIGFLITAVLRIGWTKQIKTRSDSPSDYLSLLNRVDSLD
ncbi:VanZ family protein [Crateriforma conspicua]|uniref:VanZ like family protein n=1 Tax=Crateriforma conspicua TaxID=2527996 RepID=A0A5C5Y8E2_9PLAN|nr:VanZ family protein [Crateriforma conspicua]TWT70535.1 VanZ like family protein [Crateriforma conspicua]